MLRGLLPPFCLMLAIAMATVGFTLIALGEPEASIELHQARAAGDEALMDVLEAELSRQQTLRVVLIVLVLSGSGIVTVLAFVSMRRTV